MRNILLVLKLNRAMRDIRNLLKDPKLKGCIGYLKPGGENDDVSEFDYQSDRGICTAYI
jgi:hypothetical protein